MALLFPPMFIFSRLSLFSSSPALPPPSHPSFLLPTPTASPFAGRLKASNVYGERENVLQRRICIGPLPSGQFLLPTVVLLLSVLCVSLLSSLFLWLYDWLQFLLFVLLLWCVFLYFSEFNLLILLFSVAMHLVAIWVLGMSWILNILAQNYYSFLTPYHHFFIFTSYYSWAWYVLFQAPFLPYLSSSIGAPVLPSWTALFPLPHLRQPPPPPPHLSSSPPHLFITEPWSVVKKTYVPWLHVMTPESHLKLPIIFITSGSEWLLQL